MTPFQLETNLAQKIAQLPNDASINGALVLVETSEGKMLAIQVGEMNVQDALAKATTMMDNVNRNSLTGIHTSITHDAPKMHSVLSDRNISEFIDEQKNAI